MSPAPLPTAPPGGMLLGLGGRLTQPPLPEALRPLTPTVPLWLVPMTPPASDSARGVGRGELKSPLVCKDNAQLVCENALR
mmetsp:Transcript_65234/g.183628  ORF Transcript_65234/g.183628 Transcript_65234/m.183628 type:complete len:81 (-) Transcript_65234:160-402(-)